MHSPKNKVCEDCAFYAESNYKYIAHCPNNINYSDLKYLSACLFKMQICNGDDKACSNFRDSWCILNKGQPLT